MGLLHFLLLVLTGSLSFLLHAHPNTVFILHPSENASDSSSRNSLPFPWQSDSRLKPAIILNGAPMGHDDHGHGYGGGGSPQMPILAFGSALSTQAKSGQQDGSSGTASGPGFNGQKSSDNQPAANRRDLQGAGNIPPSDEAMDSALAEAISMLDTLDVLFQQSDVIITLLLDLDGTILARRDIDRRRQRALRERFKTFVEQWRSQGRLNLVIVTGAILREEVAEFFARHQLPVPDAIIANPLDWKASYHVEFFNDIAPGTLFPEHPLIDGVHITDRSLTIDNYFQFLSTVAGQLPQVLQQRGFGAATVQISTRQNMVQEVSFAGAQNFSSEQWQSAIRQLVFDLCGLLAKVEFEAERGTVQVVLPMTKGGSVSHLASVLPLAGARVIAAGDDRIDYSMILPGPDSGFSVYLAVMVSNASRDLQDAVGEGAGELLHRAIRPCLPGVVEGLLVAMKKLVPSEM